MWALVFWVLGLRFREGALKGFWVLALATCLGLSSFFFFWGGGEGVKGLGRWVLGCFGVWAFGFRA